MKSSAPRFGVRWKTVCVQFAAFLGLIGVVVGCAARPQAFSEGFYIPPKIKPLSGSAEPVALYLFSDKRGVVNPKQIGWISVIGTHGPVHASESVDVGVTRAFVEAFRARGFSVIDRTNIPFKQGKPLSDVRTAISGEILEFEDVAIRRGPFSYERRAACRIIVHVYDASSGAILWKKPYEKVNTTLSAGDNELFAECIAEAVEDFVNDSKLVEIINRRG